MRKTRQNPAWADEITEEFCEPIKRACRDYLLPIPRFDRACIISKRDTMGSGVYGIVFETDEDDCVFKITTDSTEAHFVATAINLRENHNIDPKGLVDMRAVFALPIKHDGMDVFILWRERADKVGLPCSVKTGSEMDEFEVLLAEFYDAADKAFRLAYDEQGMSIGDEQHYWTWMRERIALAQAKFVGDCHPHESEFSNAVLACYRASVELEKNPQSRFVGEALRAYMDAGILLCDVHANNVGTVSRGKCNPIWCITDPGHELCLGEKLSKIEIPLLGSR